jgi:hypothetical protein
VSDTTDDAMSIDVYPIKNSNFYERHIKKKNFSSIGICGSGHAAFFHWKIIMNIPDIKNDLKKLGFESPYLKP